MADGLYIVAVPYFPRPDNWRGGYFLDFVKSLMRMRDGVRLFVPGDGEDYEIAGVRVHTFHYHVGPCGVFPAAYAPWNRRSFERKCRELGIGWSDVDVYHAHAAALVPLADRAVRENPSVLRVLHFHNLGSPFDLRAGRLGVLPLHAELTYCAYRRWFESVDLAVFVSERQRREFGKWFPNGFLEPSVDVRKGLPFGGRLDEIELSRACVVHNGIDAELFNPVGRPERSAQRPFTVGCVANFWKSKDQMTLLRAARILNERPGLLKVIFVGSGETRADCERYVRRHGLDEVIEFRDEVQHWELPDFYRSLDLYVLPSLAEGFNCSCLEAYGCGTPFIACRDTSAEEALAKGDWNRWLFPRGDEKTLAELIDRVRLELPRQELAGDFSIDGLVGGLLKKEAEIVRGRVAS